MIPVQSEAGTQELGPVPASLGKSCKGAGDKWEIQRPCRSYLICVPQGGPDCSSACRQTSAVSYAELFHPTAPRHCQLHPIQPTFLKSLQGWRCHSLLRQLVQSRQ